MTTLAIDDFMVDTGPADFRRDQWGRPSILQPNGKRKGYTRCSSAAKTIEDTYNLEKWARRNIAYGMAYDASLVARVIAIGGEPSTWGKAEKDQVNAILEAADAVAKAHKSADIGTAVHHLTHRLDRGEEVIAGPYQADLDAYRQALLGIGLMTDPAYTECRMVNDLLEMAGTADRIVKDGDLYRVADIKTGASVEFGGLGWAAQLAAYAGGVLYDVASDERLPTPPIDPTVGYIIHLPAGQGRCDIYEVDLVAGHRAAELANEIRKIRKAAKTWIVPTGTVSKPPEQPTISGAPAAWIARGAEFMQRRDALLARYRAMSDDEKLAFTALGIDRDDLDAVEAGLDKVDKFNVVVPMPPLEIPRLGITTTPPPDEGGPVELADVLALSVRYEQLSPQAKAWTGALIAQGNKAFSWRIRDKATVRRYELYRGVLGLAEML